MGDQTPENFTKSNLEGRLMPGTLLNARYRIIDMLGKGGMGEAYRAADLTLGQSVALKFLPALAPSDPRWLERFHSEVRIAGDLLWQLYLAFEPFLRQRWPESIVTWNRLLSGRWQDTLVGTHLLVCIAM
jgi:hypothetical protein